MLVKTTAGRYGTNKVVLKKGTNVAGTYNRKGAVNPLSFMLQPVQVQQVDQDSLEERSGAVDDESEGCFKGGLPNNLNRNDSMEDSPLHG